MRPPLPSLLPLLLLVPLASAQEGPMLHMIEFRYLPDPMTVSPGEEVIAMNFDAEAHSVTSSTDRSLFDLRDIPPGGEPRTFPAPAEPGTYPYFCIYHGTADSGMRGTLVVEAGGEPEPVTPTPAATPPPASPTPAATPTGQNDGNDTPLAPVAALAALAVAALTLRRSR